MDLAGAAYVTGLTRSTNFPTLQALKSDLSGGVDGFVVKLRPDGTALTYATYLGGHGYDDGLGIVADVAGRAYVTGSTASDDFPVRDATQPRHGGFGDAYVVVIEADGTAMPFATYLGGNGFDNGFGISVDGSARHTWPGLTRSRELAGGRAISSALARSI